MSTQQPSLISFHYILSPFMSVLLAVHIFLTLKHRLNNAAYIVLLASALE